VSPTRPSAGADDPGGFLSRRVAAVSPDVCCPVFAEGQGERLAELPVFCFQPPDALGCGLQPPQQRCV
jgi:hypothetical protein